MKKKGISPLIAYILLIGMTVAMSVTVSIYLKNQAQGINFNSKEVEVYCADVAMDAELVCANPIEGSANMYILGLNINNRGYYSISNLIVSKKEIITKTLNPDEFSFFVYKSDGFLESTIQPIKPSGKALLKIVVDKSIIQEITIAPSIIIDNKGAICNEKVFKLSIDTSIINSLGDCPS